MLAAAAVSAQSVDGFPESRFFEQRESFTPDGGAPIELRFLIAREGAGQAERLVRATRAALTVMSEWFGPLPAASGVEGSLTVAGVPWRSHGAPTDESVLIAPLRWLTPARDQSTERAVIAAMVRRYWDRGAAPTAFEQSLIIYSGTRAMHQLLEGSNFATLRFFGGAVPFSLRSLLLSPPVAYPRPRVWGFDELGSPAATTADVRRGVRALQTVERYVGWPAMLAALSRIRESGARDSDRLAAALSEARGTDLRSLVAECLRADAVFDYAIDDLRSAPGNAGLIETTVTIGRRGSGRFPAVPVVVRFADGSEARDHVDGMAPSTTLVYSAPTAAVAATIDPDTMLVLDDDRDNNAVVRAAPTSPLGVRLAMNWMAWLQNTMLSYTALV